MSGYNLPPGCLDSDLPGNSDREVAQQRAWEQLHDWVDEELDGEDPETIQRVLEAHFINARD